MIRPASKRGFQRILIRDLGLQSDIRMVIEADLRRCDGHMKISTNHNFGEFETVVSHKDRDRVGLRGWGAHSV